MSNSVFIKLSEEDLDHCNELASEYALRAEKYAKDFTKGKANNFEFKLIGAFGEMAVSKLFQMPWGMMQFDTRHDGDIGKIEVKSTTKLNGDLIVPLDNNSTRPYVLCRVKKPWVEIVGFLWPEEIFNDNNKVFTNGLMRPSYIIRSNRLHHISELVRLKPS